MADLRKYLQAQKFTLKNSISLSDTSIELASFNLPDGTAIASADLGSINYATIAPGTANEEQVSFTGFSGTTLTGVTRGLKFNDDYTQDTDLRKAHAAGTKVVISNTAGFYGDFVNKYNDETISGTLSVPTPTSGSHAASKDYVDGLTLASGISYDRIVVQGTAGETIATGNLVYFDDTDNEWKKCDANTATTVNEVLLGIAQGAGTNGNPITGGVLLRGVDETQTGMTAGVKLYASDTAGAIAESAGTTEKIVGFSFDTDKLYFDPYFGAFVTANEKDAMSGGGDLGTPAAGNKYMTQTGLSPAISDLYDAVTFPTVESTTSNEAANSDAVSQTAPSGTVSGDLVVVILRQGGTVSVAPSGYTEILSTSYIYIYAKIATGSDTFSCTLSSAANGWCTHAYRISNYWGASTVSDIVTATGATTSGSHNPPVHNPDNAHGFYLWIAASSTSGTTGTVTGAPTNYSNGIFNQSGDGDAGEQHLGSARRELRAIDEDPGAFTGNISGDTGQATIAIRAAETFLT